jgi:hypothetical protein
MFLFIYLFIYFLLQNLSQYLYYDGDVNLRKMAVSDFVSVCKCVDASSFKFKFGCTGQAQHTVYSFRPSILCMDKVVQCSVQPLERGTKLHFSKISMPNIIQKANNDNVFVLHTFHQQLLMSFIKSS